MASASSPSLSKSAQSSALSRVPTVPTIETITPNGGQSWSAYWTIVTALALFAFVIYIAATGLAAQWVQLFAFSTPNIVQPGSALPGTGAATGPLAAGGTGGANVLSQALQSLGVPAGLAGILN